MDSFEDKVDYCRKNDTADLIDNAAWGHAQYLFKNLLAVAAEKKEDVRIISGHLRADFYESLSKEIGDCINSGAKIDIVVLQDDIDIEEHKFAELVNNYQNGNIIVLNDKDNAEIPHMLLIGGGGERFRLETDHSQTKAVASFNNEGMGRMLLNIYDDFMKNIPQPQEVC